MCFVLNSIYIHMYIFLFLICRSRIFHRFLNSWSHLSNSLSSTQFAIAIRWCRYLRHVWKFVQYKDFHAAIKMIRQQIIPRVARRYFPSSNGCFITRVMDLWKKDTSRRFSLFPSGSDREIHRETIWIQSSLLWSARQWFYSGCAQLLLLLALISLCLDGAVCLDNRHRARGTRSGTILAFHARKTPSRCPDLHIRSFA